WGTSNLCTWLIAPTISGPSFFLRSWKYRQRSVNRASSLRSSRSSGGIDSTTLSHSPRSSIGARSPPDWSRLNSRDIFLRQLLLRSFVCHTSPFSKTKLAISLQRFVLLVQHV